MANRIDINELTSEVNKILIDYGNEISEGAHVSATEVGKETVKQLKATSPKREGGGDYAKGWKMENPPANRLGSFSVIIHNPKHYRLTHLLEQPHLMRNGKMSTPQPHIALAEEQAVAAFEKKLRELI